tara:strand:- start:4031 stop:4342 length:312 start_codon:yes stop_codon:yes gene_type:complete
MSKEKFFRDNAKTFIINIAETIHPMCQWAEILDSERDGGTYSSIIVRDIEANDYPKLITRNMIQRALQKLSFDELDRIENHDYDWILCDKVLQLAYHKEVIYG